MVSRFDGSTIDAEQGLCRFNRTSVTNHVSKVWRILLKFGESCRIGPKQKLVLLV